MSRLFCLNIFLQERFFFFRFRNPPIALHLAHVRMLGAISDSVSLSLCLQLLSGLIISVPDCTNTWFIFLSLLRNVLNIAATQLPLFNMHWVFSQEDCNSADGLLFHPEKKCHAASISIKSMPCKSIYWRKYSIETAPHFVLGMAYLPSWRCKAEYASLFFSFYMTSP